MQPTHCTSDMRFVVDRIGEDRARFAYIWKSFFDQGIQVPFGSDFPVEEVFYRPHYQRATHDDFLAFFTASLF